MMRLITLITENIFAVLGFALYAGLVYYMVEKALRRYSGKGNRSGKGISFGKKNSPGNKSSYGNKNSFGKGISFEKGNKKDAEEQKPRKNFGRSFPASRTFPDQNPPRPGSHYTS